jgi:hypothetical protein
LPNYQEKCESASTTFHDLLKDGLILCEYGQNSLKCQFTLLFLSFSLKCLPCPSLTKHFRLINKLTETSIAKPSSSNLPFKQRVRVPQSWECLWILVCSFRKLTSVILYPLLSLFLLLSPLLIGEHLELSLRL